MGRELKVSKNIRKADTSKKRFHYKRNRFNCISSDSCINLDSQIYFIRRINMEIDTSDLNDEDIIKINDFIYSLKKEKKPKKWWIVPLFDAFSRESIAFGERYIVREQEDFYSKNRPPLKSDFSSKEEAEKWLKNYLEEEESFDSAIDDIDNLACNFDYIIEKLQEHKYITENDWTNCFRLFDDSMENGALFKVTKGIM